MIRAPPRSKRQNTLFPDKTLFRSNPEDTAPAQIGVYRIVGEIGRGGMGAVYLGERCDGQFEQRVAIKVVHDGIGGRLIARFREERRTLAQLEHPGIAYRSEEHTSALQSPMRISYAVFCVKKN